MGDSPPKLQKKRFLICFSPEDKDGMEELRGHLTTVSATVTLWSINKVEGGRSVREEFTRVVNEADAALLMLSMNFFAALDEEQPKAPEALPLAEQVKLVRQQHEQRGLGLIPLVWRSCFWSGIPWLAKLQALPKNREYIRVIDKAERDQTWTEIARELAAWSPNPGPPDLNVAEPAPNVAAPVPNVAAPVPNVAAPAPNVAAPTPAVAISAPNVAAPAPDIAISALKVAASAPSRRAWLLAVPAVALVAGAVYVARVPNGQPKAPPAVDAAAPRDAAAPAPHDLTPPPTPWRVEGLIRDQRSQPLAGVTVTLPERGLTTITNEHGHFGFEVAAEQSELVLLRAELRPAPGSKRRYQPQEIHVNLGSTKLDIVLDGSR